MVVDGKNDAEIGRQVSKDELRFCLHHTKRGRLIEHPIRLEKTGEAVVLLT